jgi:hypothetical protein
VESYTNFCNLNWKTEIQKIKKGHTVLGRLLAQGFGRLTWQRGMTWRAPELVPTRGARAVARPSAVSATTRWSAVRRESTGWTGGVNRGTSRRAELTRDRRWRRGGGRWSAVTPQNFKFWNVTKIL